jgi:hypothetical protein
MNTARSRLHVLVLLACGLATVAACGSGRVPLSVEDGVVPGPEGDSAGDAGKMVDTGANEADAPDEAAMYPCSRASQPMMFAAGDHSDARRLKSVACVSTVPGSDVEVDVQPIRLQTDMFVASVTQTKPTALDLSFCAIPHWSGHFFNFEDLSDTVSGPTTIFHLRARGLGPPGGDQPGDDNVQVNWTWSSNTGDLADDSIHCVAQLN